MKLSRMLYSWILLTILLPLCANTMTWAENLSQVDNSTAGIVVSMKSNAWFVSDHGSDDNDCHTEYSPCKNLQTVIDRAEDSAAIYVTSKSLSLDYLHQPDEDGFMCCVIKGSLSFRIESLNGTNFRFTCSGWFFSDLSRFRSNKSFSTVHSGFFNHSDF